MNARLTGILFLAVGLLAAGTSLTGLVQGNVWFLGRGGFGLRLIESASTPASFWFVVCFYLVAGLCFAAFGIRFIRDDDRRG